jgi:hypothetical protein
MADVNAVISLGIGSPADIPHFLLVGLSINDAEVIISRTSVVAVDTAGRTAVSAVDGGGVTSVVAVDGGGRTAVSGVG